LPDSNFSNALGIVEVDPVIHVVSKSEAVDSEFVFFKAEKKIVREWARCFCY
jgi:hypothetical protein